MLKKVSIITVVFNGEKYLRQTIESVKQQDYTNIEYIIIDGGSTDNTVDIIKQNSENIDFWVSEKDNGLADAMNKGVKAAKGEYIMHLHSDDSFINSHSVSDLINELSGSNKKWACGFYLYHNSKGKVTKKEKFRDYDFKDMLIRNIIRHQCTVVPREVFENFSFNPRYKYAMDYDFFLNVWHKYDKPVFVQKHISYFRLDGNNLSSNYIASITDEMRARIQFRSNYNQIHKLPYDLLVFLLRIFKVYFYHNLRKKSRIG